MCMILFHILASSSSSMVVLSNTHVQVGCPTSNSQGFQFMFGLFRSFRPYHVLKKSFGFELKLVHANLDMVFVLVLRTSDPVCREPSGVLKVFCVNSFVRCFSDLRCICGFKINLPLLQEIHFYSMTIKKNPVKNMSKCIIMCSV